MAWHEGKNYSIHFTFMPGHEYPVLWVTAQKDLLPMGIMIRMEKKLPGTLQFSTGSSSIMRKRK